MAKNKGDDQTARTLHNKIRSQKYNPGLTPQIAVVIESFTIRITEEALIKMYNGHNG